MAEVEGIMTAISFGDNPVLVISYPGKYVALFCFTLQLISFSD